MLHDTPDEGPNPLEERIAARLAGLRAERGWSLETLAQRTGISRATLSRLERGELSPTAAMLSTLCGQYGWTLSRLMAEAEGGFPSVVRSRDQVEWKDPGSGYIRRVVSPPHSHLKGELVEVRLPANTVVSFGTNYFPGLEHHLWMIEGSMCLELDESSVRLEKGDCVRYVLAGASKFVCGTRPARYVIALIHP